MCYRPFSNHSAKPHQNKMKNHYKLLCAIFCSMLIVSSCNDGGKEIEAIKLIPVKSGKDFQYVDLEGKIVINPQFQEASIFRNGLALVKSSGENAKWGYIGEDGKYIISGNYLRATVFTEDLAWVVMENGAPTCINTKGEVKFTLQNAEEVRTFCGGLAAFKSVDDKGQEKWGFVDKDGKVKVNQQFANVGAFNNGKCPVSNLEGKWGFIDSEGKIVVNYQFDFANPFFKGSAVVQSNGKAGLIDESGKYIINPQFTDIQNDGDLFLVDQEGKYGWTDKDGKVIINPQFSRAFPFNNGNLAAVKTDQTYGYIDKEGKIVINPQFDKALPFNGNLALVVSSNKYGFINSEGKYVINPQYDDVSKDLEEYYHSGGSFYSSVVTDYFNAAAIVSRIKVDAPEGLTYNTSINEILTKFKKTSVDVSKYGSEVLIISNEKLSGDAYLTFYLIGSPWNSDGYYDYTFNSDFKPEGFSYSVSLSGKGIGKEKSLKEEIEKSLIGYTKDDSRSNENSSVYNNSKQEVTVYTKEGNLTVLITKVNSVPGESSYSLPDGLKPESMFEETSEEVSGSELGEWSGDFGNNVIMISIESIKSDGSVSGYNIIKNNRRNLIGTKSGNNFTLKEPGDQYWDGVFKFIIDENDVANGTWKSNNGKINREFNLAKQ